MGNYRNIDIRYILVQIAIGLIVTLIAWGVKRILDAVAHADYKRGLNLFVATFWVLNLLVNLMFLDYSDSVWFRVMAFVTTTLVFCSLWTQFSVLRKEINRLEKALRQAQELREENK